MGEYVLSCCSTADLTEEHFRERDLHYVCFHFELNGKGYLDDLGKTIHFDEFYLPDTAAAETPAAFYSPQQICLLPSAVIIVQLSPEKDILTISEKQYILTSFIKQWSRARQPEPRR
mgnify:CR=1 FL=1